MPEQLYFSTNVGKYFPGMSNLRYKLTRWFNARFIAPILTNATLFGNFSDASSWNLPHLLQDMEARLTKLEAAQEETANAIHK